MAEEEIKTVTPDEAAVAAAAAQAAADKAAEAAAQEGEKPAEAKETTEEKTSEETAAEEGDAETSTAEEKTEEDPDAEEKPVELDQSVWGSTGSETGDAVLKVLQDAGADPAAAKALMYDAIQAGDVTKIDEAGLTAMLGEAQAKIVLMGAKTFIQETNAANAQIVETVHKTAGGEENWKKVSEWADKAIPASEMNDYRELVNAGGAKARFAAQEMLAAYNGDAKNTALTAPRVEAEANTSTPSAEPITARQYVEALEKAHKRNAKPSEIKKIEAQRAAGRKQGLK